jgi:hypothetical protein
MMGWKLTWYSLGAQPGGMQPGKVRFQVQSCGFRQSFLKMVPCPSSQLQLILCSMKVLSRARGRADQK